MASSTHPSAKSNVFVPLAIGCSVILSLARHTLVFARLRKFFDWDSLSDLLANHLPYWMGDSFSMVFWLVVAAGLFLKMPQAALAGLVYLAVNRCLGAFTHETLAGNLGFLAIAPVFCLAFVEIVRKQNAEEFKSILGLWKRRSKRLVVESVLILLAINIVGIIYLDRTVGTRTLRNLAQWEEMIDRLDWMAVAPARQALDDMAHRIPAGHPDKERIERKVSELKQKLDRFK